MRRLKGEFLDRTCAYAHRMVDVAEELERKVRSRRVVGRVVDQLVGCGTSVAANTREADEAVSLADFCRSLGTVIKELAEGGFWLSFVGDRGWIPSDLLAVLRQENAELTRIVHVIIARTRVTSRAADASRKRGG